MMAIREAGRGDVPLLNRLIRESFRDVAERFGLTPDNCPSHPAFGDEARVSAAMDKGTRFFLLEGEGSVRGCAALEAADARVCYLRRLAVLPACRRRGFGSLLVLHVLEQARRMGAERVEIGIIAGQPELAAWYRGLGFEETGRRRFEHLPFEVAFMRRDLIVNI